MVSTFYFKDLFPFAGRKLSTRYFIAFVSVVTATAAQYLFDKYAGYYLSPFTLFYPAVVVAAWYGGFGPALFATIISVVASVTIFISPFYIISASDTGELLQLILFAFSGITICFLTQNLSQSLLKQNETARELIHSQNKVTNILESIQGCFFSLDEKGRFIHINEDDKNYLPCSREELYKMSFWEGFHGWKNTLFEEQLNKVMEKKKAVEFEFHDSLRARWFEVHISPAIDGVSVHLYNITDRKQAEEDLKSAYEDMEKRVQMRTAQLGKINETLIEEIGERKKVEKEVLEISEKEQRRLGTQIHDDLCQSLTGIMMLTKVLTQKMERQEIKEFHELKKIGELLNQSITQAREMARGFYPVELQADSLMIALNDLAQRAALLNQITCQFSCQKPILIEDNDIVTHLYRIVQEAVHNAVKHGKAKKIEIRLIQENKKIILEIQDDGEGVPLEREKSSGIGLHIMKYRARMINADLSIQHNSPHGTLLKCSFPYSL